MSFGPLGVPELMFILVLALLIFGPKRLPEMGRTIGKGMAEFRKASSDLKRTIEREIDFDERSPAPARREAASLPAPTSPASKPGASPDSGPTSSEAGSDASRASTATSPPAAAGAESETSGT